MKIYLAGKIAKNDWRTTLVPELRDTYTDTSEWEHGWTTTPMYRTDFHYTGPYFISCDHGCAHGDLNHGAGIVESGCIDMPMKPHMQSFDMRVSTAARCRQAIQHCDVFFAWLENPCTAYGTLVEIGMAHSLSKTIVIGSNDDELLAGDAWFAAEHASYLAVQPTAELAFKDWADRMHPYDENRAKCESPLETAVWDTYRGCSPAGNIRNQLVGLVTQHEVSVEGRTYRLDFALPDKKIAFEMDGYTYHGKEREHFNRDRRRDLDLKLAGWEVHRFDGDMIRDSPVQVLEIAAKLAEARHGECG